MLLVLNLKMNLSKNEILKYENAIHDKEVIVLPQFPYIPFFRSGKYLLGSQDVSKYSKGAYTGEVCAKGLRDLNCSYVLVGHSERKINFNETINDSRMKIQNVIDNDMIPIYCVNQTEEELTTDKELKNIENQLEAIPNYIKYIVVAFEPVWLIGHKEEVNIRYIERVLKKIKEYLMERNINHSIIYGGGIRKDNIDYLLEMQCNNGFIICLAHLKNTSMFSFFIFW